MTHLCFFWAAITEYLTSSIGSSSRTTTKSVQLQFQVGALYPTAPDPSYVIFKPTPNQTPALRAGNLSPYQFWIPPSWKEARVANILSGNYCQPKCAGEPSPLRELRCLPKALGSGFGGVCLKSLGTIYSLKLTLESDQSWQRGPSVPV